MKKITTLTFLVAGLASTMFAAPDARFEVSPDGKNAARKEADWSMLGLFEQVARNADLPTYEKKDAVNLFAWRGETANFRFAVAAGDTELSLNFPKKITLRSQRGKKIEATISPVRYAVGQGNRQFADIVDPAGTATTVPAGTLREFLVSVDVPADATAGVYRGTIPSNFSDKKGLSFSLGVLSAQLPEAENWGIHLDIWQHPQAVARWAGVKPWSKAHFDALVGPMTRLRDLGQKTITCSIIEEPWNHQTFDDWESMVKWTRKADGKWDFDYSIFDAWVSFMIEKIGIDEQISCYSMLPWMMKIRYFDEASKSQKEVKLNINSPEFEQVWGAFLTDFKAHVQKKGWLKKTFIALDERPDAQLNAARKVIEKYAPEFKIVSANDHPTKMSEFVYDISPTFTHSGGDVPALAVKRRAEGRKTTFYICTNPPRPNTFTHSAPAEAHWLGFYAAANGFDGILRWAYNSWNSNPFETTAFGNWPAGDCFLIYPGNLSSMRLEHLRDGIEDFEKIQILRAAAAKPNAPAKLKKAVAELDDYLKATFTVAAGGATEHKAQTLRAMELLADASKQLRAR